METFPDSSWLWLENSTLSNAIRQWTWAYPIIEVIHILGLAILFGSIAMFDLRLLGFSRQVLVTDMSQHLLPWTYLSFTIVVLSGIFLFSVDATEIAANPAFRFKLLLITIAGMNAAWFHAVPTVQFGCGIKGVPTPIVVKFTAILSLILWIAVITCGRFIAYL